MSQPFRLWLLWPVYVLITALSTIPPARQWWLWAGAWTLASLVSMWLLYCLMYFMRCEGDGMVFTRPFPGTASRVAVFGLLLPAVSCYLTGSPHWPWAQLMLCASVMAFAGVVLVELFSWFRCVFRRDGIIFSTVFSERYFLYGEPAIPGKELVPDMIVRCRAVRLTDRFFASTSDTPLVLRAMTCAASKHPLPERDDDSEFFLSRLAEKSSLGMRFLAGAFLALSALLVSLLDPLFLPAIFYWPARIILLATGLAGLTVILWWADKESARARITRTWVFVPLFISAWYWKLSLFTTSLVLAMAAMAMLAYLAIRYRKGEKKALQLLSEDRYDEALAVMENLVPGDESAPWQSFKAYALALRGHDFTRALKLARADLQRPAAPLTFLTACSAAALCFLGRDEKARARMIASKVLLRFPYCVDSPGIYGRCAQTLRAILEDDFEETSGASAQSGASEALETS